MSLIRNYWWIQSITKINQYQWKELLKITTSTIFDGKILKTREYTAPWNCEILYTDICMLGGMNLPPNTVTFLCRKRWFCMVISSPYYHISKLGRYTNSKVFFQLVAIRFCLLILIKIWEKPWKSLAKLWLVSRAFWWW